MLYYLNIRKEVKSGVFRWQIGNFGGHEQKLIDALGEKIEVKSHINPLRGEKLFRAWRDCWSVSGELTEEELQGLGLQPIDYVNWMIMGYIQRYSYYNNERGPATRVERWEKEAGTKIIWAIEQYLENGEWLDDASSELINKIQAIYRSRIKNQDIHPALKKDWSFSSKDQRGLPKRLRISKKQEEFLRDRASMTKEEFYSLVEEDPEEAAAIYAEMPNSKNWIQALQRTAKELRSRFQEDVIPDDAVEVVPNWRELAGYNG